jgi:hypothetical protein
MNHHGALLEDLAGELLSVFPEEGRGAALTLLRTIRDAPYAWPHVADGACVEDVREAHFGCCWMQYALRSEQVEILEIGWLG